MGDRGVLLLPPPAVDVVKLLQLPILPSAVCLEFLRIPLGFLLFVAVLLLSCCMSSWSGIGFITLPYTGVWLFLTNVPYKCSETITLYKRLAVSALEAISGTKEFVNIKISCCYSTKQEPPSSPLKYILVFLAIYISRVVEPSSTIVVNFPRTNEKLHCKGEPYQFSG